MTFRIHVRRPNRLASRMTTSWLRVTAIVLFLGAAACSGQLSGDSANGGAEGAPGRGNGAAEGARDAAGGRAAADQFPS